MAAKVCGRAAGMVDLQWILAGRDEVKASWARYLRHCYVTRTEAIYKTLIVPGFTDSITDFNKRTAALKIFYDIPVHLMAKSQKPSVSQPAKDAEKNKPIPPGPEIFDLTSE
ncbi:MAG: hypothetical protein FRX48_00232 [Lasallia pustulata]|uniref:Uncharacterized protein n=1 Tax=Lasallia pustulata TaxID=136370 RepID=A0A5M8Q2C2_9LECA|nr:MAG: hypothetical protein FRX48_00232 [Lasallia pustulata]